MENKSENNINVLYVDDEAINLFGFKSSNNRYMNVHLAISGQEALEILEKTKIEIVITDQKMPNMTGVQLLTKIYKEYPDIRRYILTGYMDNNEVLKAFDEGIVEEYFTKPYKFSKLRNKILKSTK